MIRKRAREVVVKYVYVHVKMAGHPFVAVGKYSYFLYSNMCMALC